jgi:CRP/FNR family transcriptional regulator, cyclic AMP receptor protein
MPKATQQQDLSAVSSSKHGLLYLTANDWMLIADKATRVKFKAGDCLIQQGKRTHGVYVLLQGTVSVQIPAQENQPALGPGEVCGEISFIDELPATVNVCAKEPVEAYYLDRPMLQTMFELYPHLGSRFYHSLAASLSHRLRELIAQGAALPRSPV